MTTDEMLGGYALAVVAVAFICAVTAALRDLIDKWIEKCDKRKERESRISLSENFTTE